MGEASIPFSELLAGYGTTTIGEGMRIESVFALLKLRAEDGRPSWAVRSGGVQLPKEELLGVLDGLTASIRQKLTSSWKGTTPPAGTARHQPPAPIPFSELLSGLETVRVAEEQLIESVFTVIKARRVDGFSVWHVRTSEMKLGSEELLGALDGYAATVRHDLAGAWNW